MVSSVLTNSFEPVATILPDMLYVAAGNALIYGPPNGTDVCRIAIGAWLQSIVMLHAAPTQFAVQLH
jgi:hypothetical protein